MTGRWIIHADDLGLHPDVNEGIFKAYSEGALTSTSLMACGQAFESAVAGIQRHPNLDIGLHFTLDEERPVSPAHLIPHLTTSEGRFLPRGKLLLRLFLGQIPGNEIALEFTAQLERCSKAGLKLSHLDGHGHCHVFPNVSAIIAPLAASAGLRKVRIPRQPLSEIYPLQSVYRIPAVALINTFARWSEKVWKSHGFVWPDQTFGLLQSGKLNARGIERLLSEPNLNQTIEIVTHPGSEQTSLKLQYGHWGYHWRDELQSLLDVFQNRPPELEPRLTTFESL